ncbi:MAG: ATP-dependent DNA helicase RecQ [Candidatus Electrothrix sp. GW3-4]|uniref:RecQ family ATP-dependent DNA helicase n=1 Tax=Candidatus Electrothrix sp. GW3-4 TaxID=3126740 RepID=UPI0030CC91D7
MTALTSITSTPGETLQQVFGFDAFLPGQEVVISAVLAGRSALAIFPTGQGKSLCYQLPALHLPGLTLVISPLMALMKDQVDFLIGKGIAAARLDSSLDFNQVNAVYGQLQGNELKLLYVAPERFANERFVGLVSRLRLSLMVIDEAHCISEWGHNFRPDYLKLAELAKGFAVPAVLGLTATATPQVAADIRQSFSVAESDCIQTGFYRPNLSLLFEPNDEPDQALVRRLTEQQESGSSGPTIVYVTLQQTAMQVAGLLAKAGFAARPYHAGMKDEQRQEVQDWFMASDEAVVVATIAFGMGIDKSNIRAVFHYNLPKSLENYAQEIGRAGRDGLPAVCIMLGNGNDLHVLENFVYGDTPEPEQVQAFVDHILGQEAVFSCSIYDLSGQFDMRPLVVKTLLTYLELEGLLASTGPFYSSYSFKPLRPSVEILPRFDAEHQAFLKRLLSCAVKQKIWFSIDLDEAAQRTGSPRKRVIAALDYLEQQGDLVLKVSGARLGFRRLAADHLDIVALKDELVKRFAQREQSDLDRLGLVVDLVNHPGCKTGFLLRYFGEERPANCGHCSFCLEEKNNTLINGRANTPVSEQDNLTEKLQRVQREYPQALASPRQITRLLCGLSSPGLTRNKLSRHELFGRLEQYPFAAVMEWVTDHL